MDIKKVDIKKKLMAGSVMAVLSGFVPPVAGVVHAGTATVGIDVDLVTAITLSNTNALDFGRIAITGGGPASGTHILSPAGVVTPATNTSVVVAGVPGNFDIGGGVLAGNVVITIGAAVTYDGGDISIDQLTFGGPALTAAVPVAAGGTAGAVFGGASTDVQVGGRMVFSGTPAVGAYTGNSFVVNINDLP